MTPGKLNPYTKAMLNCLEQYKGCKDTPKLDDTTSQFLANMIQGRFLQYISSRICQYYEIIDKDMEKQLSMSLMKILSDKFFAVFREKVNAKPEIVFIMAKKITSNETCPRNSALRTDAFFRIISKQYFEYQNFQFILRWINSNPEIEKIVFISRIQKRIKDSSLIKALLYIIQNDKDGITPSVFNRYLVKNRLDRLNSLVKSGDWKIEASYVQEQSMKMINWRQYMETI
ncbi:hypothetical protein KKA14_09990 [bacterium]|nr:hypothetical protein [bacterium]